LGEGTGDTAQRVRALAQLLDAGGLPTRVVADIAAVEWSKLAQVAATMAAQAVTGMYVHELLTTPETSLLVKRLIDEAAAVARADGVELVDSDGPYPVATVAGAPTDAACEILRSAGERLVARGATAMRTSMLQSLDSGRPTETEAIHGELVREAGRRGVPAPVTEVCYRIIRRRQTLGTHVGRHPGGSGDPTAAAQVLAAAGRRAARTAAR
jgi:2-dehydropantoate 2-reductase